MAEGKGKENGGGGARDEGICRVMGGGERVELQCNRGRVERLSKFMGGEERDDEL